MNPKNVKIILIEDDEDDQLLFSMALDIILIPTDLTIIKHTIDLKNNVMLIQKLSPYIIFIDLNLGAINGFKYLETVKDNELLKHIPCIILTDSKLPLNIETAYNYGANLYIVKPIEFSVLTDIIKFVYNLNWDDYSPPKREMFFMNHETL